MGFWERLTGQQPQTPQSMRPAASAGGQQGVFLDLNSPAVLEFLRGTLSTSSGITVTVEMALRNPTVFRCLDLTCGAMAMLPLKLHRGNEVASEHPVHRLLHRRPNDWQTPFEFKGLMQYRALVQRKGAVAMIVHGARGPTALLPLNPDRVEMELTSDFQAKYFYSRKGGGRVPLQPNEVLHLRGLTFDGINGISRVEKAAEAIAIAIQAERATASLFRHGSYPGGGLEIPQELSEESYNRLREDMNTTHEGAENAGKTIILEGGAKFTPFASTAREAQSIESRRFQVEEILRTFGVPRPLAMMDDTGWGTGIEQLSIGFVRFGLNPWFRAWEEAINRSCLTDAEHDLGAKFNPGALLNGTMKDQFEAFAKASGAGGHMPWYTPNEIRAKLNEPPHPDGDKLQRAAATAAPPAEDTEADDIAADALAKRRESNKKSKDNADD